MLVNAVADKKTTVLSFPELQKTYGKGCYGHPSVSGKYTSNLLLRVMWFGVPSLVMLGSIVDRLLVGLRWD